MSDLTSYKIVFASVGKNLKDNPQDVAYIISSTFKVKLEEVLKIVNQAPIVLFEDLSVRDVSRMQNAVIFLTKMGIDITITPEKCSRLSTTNWKLTHTPPITSCPSCGDTFILLNSSSFLSHNKPPQPSLSQAAISAEFEEIEGLSAELESIVQMDEDSDIEEIEEIGSVSQELEEMGSFSEELEKIGDLAEELEELTNNEKLSPHHASRIEDIEGISAEFEEIEGVSAEFERICMEDMEDIGSLSAELEEIEGISAEFEKISEDNIERLDHSNFGNFAETASLDDEMESISAELEKIAEPIAEEAPIESEESFTQLFLSGEKKKQRQPQPSSLVIQPGAYDVIININPKGNVALANKTISKLLQMNVDKVAAITRKHPAVTVAKRVSKDTAQAILQQFFKYKMSGHIKINKS